MKRQNTTGLAPSAISGLSSFSNGVELRIGRLGQALGLRHERGERIRLRSRPEAGSTSTASPSSASSSNTCSFEPVGFGGEAVAQRARGGGGRRADAAHQRQRAPERQPPPALVGAGALDDAEAVVEHGVVECAGEHR